MANSSLWCPNPPVSSLPGSPTDGQVINFLADSTNGVVWALQYRSASSSTYKWEFIGGSPMFAEIVTLEACQANSNGGYGDAATVGPSIAVPLAGDFDYSFGASFLGTAGAPDFRLAPQYGATAAADNDSARFQADAPSTNWGDYQLTRSVRRTRAQAETVTLKYYRFGIGSPQVRKRYIQIQPVRVG